MSRKVPAPEKIIVLRPLGTTRVLNAAAPLILVIPFAVLSELPTTQRLLLFLPLLVLAAILSIRFWRLSVTLYPDRAVVRGYLWSRTVRRDRVTEVSDLAWMVWTTAAGRRRRTPLTAVWVNGSALPRYAKHAAKCLQRAQMWAR